MRFFHLDSFVARLVSRMAVVPGHEAPTPIWEMYRTILRRHESGFGEFELLKRFAFYERTRKAYAVVSTGEKAVYANIILKKGLVKPEIGFGAT
jgi:L-fucose mutarotase